MTRASRNRQGPFRDDEEFISNKCSLCGDDCGDDGYYAEGYRICRSCAEEMDLQDVLDLFGFDSVGELITALCGDEV